MLHGEFRRGDGLTIPNNITDEGARRLLDAACVNISVEFWVGLVSAVPTRELEISDVIEPSAANGYARQQISRSEAGWPIRSTFNGEPYVESANLVWEPVGGSFDQPIRRLMLCTALTGGEVLALSTPLPAELTIGLATPVQDRTFKYRIYLR